MNLTPGQEIILNIESIAPSGKGVGRVPLEGSTATLAVFVEGAAPGDEVRVTVTDVQKKYIEARPLLWLRRSKDRVEPPCPHYGPCGGCAIMHLSDEAQRAAKQDFVRFALKGVLQEDTVVDPIKIPRKTIGYRNRLTFHARLHSQRGMEFGFFGRESHDLVPIVSCMLGSPSLQRVKERFETAMKSVREGSAEMDVTFAADEDTGRVAVVVDGVTNLPSSLQKKLKDFYFANGDVLAGVTALVREEKLWSEPQRVRLGYRLEVPAEGGGTRKLEILYPSHGFAQVSWDMNRRLVAAVLDAASLKGGESVLDLFCGCGNFSLPLSFASKNVTGVESDGEAVEAAIANVQAGEIKNITFLRKTFEDALGQFAKNRDRFDVAVLDPPRRGAGEKLKLLARLDVRRVVYVSCSLKTLKRDAEYLAQVGYRMKRLLPLDMFPQTHHVESVALFERAASA